MRRLFRFRSQSCRIVLSEKQEGTTANSATGSTLPTKFLSCNHSLDPDADDVIPSMPDHRIKDETDPPMRLLLVEDNEELAALIVRQFASTSFELDHAGTAADALAVIESRDYALVILDLGLPDGCGLDILQRLRSSRRSLPVLVLTARSDVSDRVLGLDQGADDYMVKPFAFPELKARITALLRRPGALLGQMLELANVQLDTVSREVSVCGQALRVPQRETQLLELLLRRADRVVPKSLVEDQLFGLEDDLGSNAIEVYVHRLRKRLEQHEAGVAIHTIRGVGYLMSAASATA
ncbi:MAG: response regulator [Janthinobacterium lividum]